MPVARIVFCSNPRYMHYVCTNYNTVYGEIQVVVEVFLECLK